MSAAPQAKPIDCEALFTVGEVRCIELAVNQVPQLQRFFETNPEYHLAVNGEAPRPCEAEEEFESLPPSGWPFERKWVLGYVDRDGEMVALADLLSDLFAKGVWNVGTFIVATRLHGTGAAAAMHAALEAWMRTRGARWSRLGVVVGNARAERFWEKTGYREVRRREGMQMGRRTNAIRVMVKPLANGDFAEYFALVKRDRPD